MQPSAGQVLRKGYTTGACAAAAARAACRLFLYREYLTEVETLLPNRQSVRFELKRCEWDEQTALCSIIKDGGDDPDCTHGAEIVARVCLLTEPTMTITGGVGVARVTKPGLGLTVGESAINPVPRNNIEEMVRLELEDSPYQGAWVEISVPDGEERSKKTLNARLGLLGGISILGTTGIVLPYSTSAFVASVVQAVGLASADGLQEIVLTTGGRSEQYAMQLLPRLPESAFIQVGDYVGIALRNAVRHRIPKVSIVAMMGKLSKMADNRMMTHASASEVNMELLARLAAELGAPETHIQDIRQANTARHVLEMCQQHNLSHMPSVVCLKAKEACENFARHQLEVCVTMVDFHGAVLGDHRYGEEKQA